MTLYAESYFLHVCMLIMHILSQCAVFFPRSNCKHFRALDVVKAVSESQGSDLTFPCRQLSCDVHTWSCKMHNLWWKRLKLVFATLPCIGVIYEHCLHEKLECMIVYCAVLSVCTSASPAISTLTISTFSLGSLTAMFLVQAVYYVYTLTIQLQNKDRSSRWCHPCILCTQSQGEKKENTEVKIFPRRSHNLLFILDITHIW